jgi:hypothetical protein
MRVHSERHGLGRTHIGILEVLSMSLVLTTLVLFILMFSVR